MEKDAMVPQKALSGLIRIICALAQKYAWDGCRLLFDRLRGFSYTGNKDLLSFVKSKNQKF